jgi:hypothetical protein
MSALSLGLVLALTAGSPDLPADSPGLAALEAGRFEEAARLLRASPSLGYEELVALGVAEARLGNREAAAAAFGNAIARNPTPTEALLERGGLYFLEGRYEDARRDLQASLALREDAHTRDLLAASLHLLGRTDEAIATWNQLGGPTVSSIEISGLERTKDRVARRELALREGERLDLEGLRVSRRRLAETGAFEQVTVRAHPRGDGSADLEVALLERHGLASSPAELAVSTLAQLADRRLALRYSNVGGTGTSFGGSWRFAEGRPEIAVGLDVPRPFGLGANLRLVGRRGRQPFLFETPTERTSRGLDLVLRRVLDPETMGEAGVTYRDRDFATPSPEAPPGVIVGAHVGLERRLFEGRAFRVDVGLRVLAAGPALGSDLSFTRGMVSLRGERDFGNEPARSYLVARVLFGVGTDSLPLDEGFAPGAGPEAPFPLRGHRQFEEGTAGVAAPLGRSLLLANVEWRFRLARLGPVDVGAAAFYDVARPDRGLAPARTYNDVGFGLRLGFRQSIVRIDWGYGLGDGSKALTLGLGQAF